MSTTVSLERMLIVQEVAVIAVIKFFPRVFFLLASPSLLVQGVEINPMVSQILLKAKVRRIREVLGRRKLLIMVLEMEFQVQLLFLLFLRSCSK